jgi:hypothetical protein
VVGRSDGKDSFRHLLVSGFMKGEYDGQASKSNPNEHFDHDRMSDEWGMSAG